MRPTPAPSPKKTCPSIDPEGEEEDQTKEGKDSASEERPPTDEVGGWGWGGGGGQKGTAHAHTPPSKGARPAPARQPTTRPKRKKKKKKTPLLQHCLL